MVTVLSDSRRVSVPSWVADIESFRRWSDSDEFPKDHKVWWLDGEVWIDMSKEQIFTHALVKANITIALGSFIQQHDLGFLLPDGVLLSNFAAEISGNPDGLFLSNETLASDRIRLIEGKEGGYTELQGSPDMVLEIVSASSEKKDAVTLRQKYHEAGIREYWIVDVRKEPVVFDILRATKKRYVRTRPDQGWVRSAVFGRSFRLTLRQGRQGHPDYRLEAK